MNKKALIFISAGLLCVMAALALYIYNTVQSGNAAEASAEIVSALSEQIAAEGESAASFPADNPDREMPSLEYEGNGYVGFSASDRAEIHHEFVVIETIAVVFQNIFVADFYPQILRIDFFKHTRGIE